MNRIQTLLYLPLGLAALVGALAVVAPEPASAQGNATASSVSNTTPEGAVRGFLIAGATHNKEALRRLALPMPEAQLAGLLEGKTPPADAQKQMATQFSGMAVKILKPGEVVELTRGRHLTIPKMADGKTTVYAQPVSMPIPMRLVKKNGKWLVDAASVLAAAKGTGAAQ